jgi:hypothetical protein
MRYITDSTTLVSADSSGVVCRYTESGWLPTTLMPQALAGPGWRAISAHEAVAVQRARPARLQCGRAGD